MNSNAKPLKVTTIRDVETGKITAYLNEFPGVLVQGNDGNDVRQKMNSLFETFLNRLESLKGNLEFQMEEM